MDITIGGLESLMAKFEAKKTSVKRAETRGIKKACLIVEAYWKENMSPESPSAPGEPPAVVSGAFRASIHHQVEEEGGHTAGTVGTSLKVYPVALEFGTSKMAARPSAQPALEKNRTNIVNAIKEELEAGE